VVERLKGLSALDGGDKATQVDHIIANTLGGDNSESNLRPIPVNENQAKALVDTYLFNLLGTGQINKVEAQQRDLNWKNEYGNLSAQDKAKFLNLMVSKSEPEKVSNDILSNLVSRRYEAIQDATTGDYSAPIELKLPILTKPTGFADLDKENKTKYYSALTTLKNNIGKLYLSGQITAQEANDAIVSIKGTQKEISNSLKKPKKLVFKKVTMKAIKVKALPKLKVKKPTRVKRTYARITLKKSKVTSFKLPKVKLKYA
jgi:hypothetical protein